MAPLVAATAAAAHPHVFVDARAQIIFDDQGRISAVRNIWKFDEAFSAFATQGLDKNGDGKLDASELAPLAKVNVTSLKAYDYFTYVLAGSAKHPFLPPNKYHLEYANSRLTLFFTLPLEKPAPFDGVARVEIFDPEYFVAFTFVKDRPVSLEGAPSGCTAAYQPPHMLDASTMNALAAIPVGQHDLPPSLLGAAAALANVINIDCPTSGPVAVAPTTPNPPMAQTAQMPPVPRLSPADASPPASAPPGRAVAPPPAAAPQAVAAAGPVAQPAAEVLMEPAPIKAQERLDTIDGAASAPLPPKKQMAAAPAAPVLHIKSEEELARARRDTSRTAGIPPVAMLAAAAALVIGIAACGVLLQRRLKRA